MQTQINYNKYLNMDIRQLANSLINAEKKETKIKENYQAQLAQIQELIKFLKSTMKNGIDKPRYYTLENSPAIKKINKWEKENPQEAEQARQELYAELGLENGNLPN